MDVSVVIPMHNREKTIESAIMSVLKQTVQPMEIIVVDDCSTDETVNIVRRICAENRIIKLLRLKKNQGAQAARNRGIKAAKGEWILFLDSDDELVYNAIELQQKAIQKNPGYDVYYGDYYRRENNKVRYINCRMRGKDGYFFQNVLFSCKALFQNSMIRKKALEDIGLLDEGVPSYQEWDTHIRLSLKHKYYYIDKPIFIYNIHEGETISKDFKRDIDGFRYVMMKNGDLFLTEGRMKGIILYYDGMYIIYKRWNNCRQYYCFFMARLFRFMLLHNLLQDDCIKITGKMWKLEFLSGFNIVVMLRNIIGRNI